MEEQMDSARPLTEDHIMGPENSAGELDRVAVSMPPGGMAAQELTYPEKLLMADWRGCWGKPLTADEFLAIGGRALEPLFHEPPIGPIPDYLDPHWSVHGCVAEYEEKLEELDRWKALELRRWLKDRIGRTWCVAGRVYELQLEKEEGATSERFWFRLVEDRT
jgi:hypothetical protein